MKQSKKILIVEDDIDLVESMKIVLEAQKFSVFTSYNPEDGYRIAGEIEPDLIILDVMFDNHTSTSGFDYAVKMKQNKILAPVPILMVTAVNKERPGFNFGIESESEYLPVDAFLNKPAQPKELVQKVKELLDKKMSKWAHWPSLS